MKTLSKLYLYDSKKELKKLNSANKMMQLTSCTSNSKVDKILNDGEKRLSTDFDIVNIVRKLKHV